MTTDPADSSPAAGNTEFIHLEFHVHAAREGIPAWGQFGILNPDPDNSAVLFEPTEVEAGPQGNQRGTYSEYKRTGVICERFNVRLGMTDGTSGRMMVRIVVRKLKRGSRFLHYAPVLGDTLEVVVRAKPPGRDDYVEVGAFTTDEAPLFYAPPWML